VYISVSCTSISTVSYLANKDHCIKLCTILSTVRDRQTVAQPSSHLYSSSVQKVRKGRGAMSRSQWCGEIGAGPSTRLQCYATTGRVVVWLAGGTNCLPRTWFPFIRKQPRIRYLFASFFFFFCRWIFRKNLLSVHINAGFKKLKRVYSLHVLSVLNFD